MPLSEADKKIDRKLEIFKLDTKLQGLFEVLFKEFMIDAKVTLRKDYLRTRMDEAFRKRAISLIENLDLKGPK
jgi:hypothetical protein